MAAVGADIAIFDVLPDDAKETAAELARDYGIKAEAFACDVTKPAEVAAAIALAADKMGTLDILFNNAGICQHKSSLEVTQDEWERIIDVNLNGVFYVAQAFAKYLIANDKKGSIINTASMSGTIVNFPQEQASYNASKAAVVHLTKSLAIEWLNYGIRVNCISPGYIFTNMTSTVNPDYIKAWLDQIPSKRMGKPEELAGAVIYLASDSATYTTGCDVIIDGGFTLV